MSKKVSLGSDGLDRNPHDIGDVGWYYEMPDGLHIYEERGGEIGVIKLRSLRAFLKRIDEKKAKQAGRAVLPNPNGGKK